MTALWRKSYNQYHNGSESNLPSFWKVFKLQLYKCRNAAALLETVLIMTWTL